MVKTVLSVIIFVLMILLCAFVIYVFNKQMKPAENNDAKTENENIYDAGNALDLAKWIGKNPEEIHLDQRYLKNDGLFLKISFDGKLFGKAANGTVFFEEDSGEIIKKAKTVFISSSEITFEKCKENLEKTYGKAQNEREEPYAEVNGGAVTYATFTADGYEITLSKASEREYIEITIK